MHLAVTADGGGISLAFRPAISAFRRSISSLRMSIFSSVEGAAWLASVHNNAALPASATYDRIMELPSSICK